MATHSSIFAWKIHGQRGLAGYSPWGRKRVTTSQPNTTTNYLEWTMRNSATGLSYNGTISVASYYQMFCFFYNGINNLPCV